MDRLCVAALLASSLAAGALSAQTAAPPAQTTAPPNQAAGSTAPPTQANGSTAAPARPGRMLVACAPGFPGTTVQAQATMDRFAAAAETAAGWKPGGLGAVYHETLEGGVARLAATDAVIALVTLPVYLEQAARLRLEPRLQIARETSAMEVFSLVAKKGAVTGPPALDGWELTGGPGFSPGFVRGPVLGEWGALPASVRITFTASPLSALRRAAAGEKLAVLLDGAATSSLPGLPFASDLEVVARSRPLPGSLLCTVGDHLPAKDADRMIKALQKMHQSPAGAEALKSIEVTRFEPIDRAALERARQAFSGQASAAR